MTEIVDFEGRRSDREKVELEREQEKSGFRKIKDDLEERTDSLSFAVWAVDEQPDWFELSSKTHQATVILREAMEAQDLAERLLDAALKEEQRRLSKSEIKRLLREAIREERSKAS